MSKPQRILIIDDEKPIREMIATSLEMTGFDCFQAGDALEAHKLIYEQSFDLVLLDWMLPGVNGVDFTRRLKRESGSAETPIIMLTAKTEEDNKITGLDAGVDDYITKPFSTRELISRIHAVLRRTSLKSIQKSLLANELKLDPVSQRVTVSEHPVHMGPTEY